jgi:hypothetical protein
LQVLQRSVEGISEDSGVGHSEIQGRVEGLQIDFLLSWDLHLGGGRVGSSERNNNGQKEVKKLVRNAIAIKQSKAMGQAGQLFFWRGGGRRALWLR